MKKYIVTVFELTVFNSCVAKIHNWEEAETALLTTWSFTFHHVLHNLLLILTQTTYQTTD